MNSFIEYLLPIIIILAYLLPKLRNTRKKAKSSPWDKPKKKVGLLARLKTMAENTSRAEADASPSVQTRPDPYQLDDSSFQQERSVEPAETKPLVKKVAQAETAPPKAVKKPDAVLSSKKTTSNKYFDYSVFPPQMQLNRQNYRVRSPARWMLRKK